jgi:tubulin polyglutamylase TTLL6/13
MKPWVLEVNHSPSFDTDSPLDLKTKTNLIRDTLRLLNLSITKKNKYDQFFVKFYRIKIEKKMELQKRML